MATSPATQLLVTSSNPVDDGDTPIDVPEKDTQFSLMIECSKTENTDTAPTAKRKKTRRGKKKFRHQTPGGTAVDNKAKGGAGEAQRPGSEAKDTTDPVTATDDDAASAVPAKRPRLNRRQRRRRSGRQPAPILRPLQVPRAPLNSTSFIIDDHENSAFYIDFDAATRRTPAGASERAGAGSQLESSTADDEDEEEAAYQFSMKDFEAVYRHAREEELAQLARPQLVDCVRQLEARVRQLEAQLTLFDPEVWVTHLQNQLLHLQEENRLLAKTREMLLKKYGGSDSDT